MTILFESVEKACIIREILLDEKVADLIQIRLSVCPNKQICVDCWFSDVFNLCKFLIEEEILCEVRGCKGNFLLRSEEILHFN